MHDDETTGPSNLFGELGPHLQQLRDYDTAARGPPTAAPAPPRAPWNCEACMFANDAGSALCDLCAFPAPAAGTCPPRVPSADTETLTMPVVLSNGSRMHHCMGSSQPAADDERPPAPSTKRPSAQLAITALHGVATARASGATSAADATSVVACSRSTAAHPLQMLHDNHGLRPVPTSHFGADASLVHAMLLSLTAKGFINPKYFRSVRDVRTFCLTIRRYVDSYAHDETRAGTYARHDECLLPIWDTIILQGDCRRCTGNQELIARVVVLSASKEPYTKLVYATKLQQLPRMTGLCEHSYREDEVVEIILWCTESHTSGSHHYRATERVTNVARSTHVADAGASDITPSALPNEAFFARLPNELQTKIAYVAANTRIRAVAKELHVDMHASALAGALRGDHGRQLVLEAFEHGKHDELRESMRHEAFRGSLDRELLNVANDALQKYRHMSEVDPLRFKLQSPTDKAYLIRVGDVATACHFEDYVVAALAAIVANGGLNQTAIDILAADATSIPALSTRAWINVDAMDFSEWNVFEFKSRFSTPEYLQTMLFRGARKCNKTMIEIALRQGATLGVPKPDRGLDLTFTPRPHPEGPWVLAHMVRDGNEDAVRMLIRYGAPLNEVGQIRVREDDNKFHPRDGPLLAFTHDTHMSAVLLDAHADVDAGQDSASCGTALHAWVLRGNADMVDFLLSRGASPNAVDNNSRTPLHYLLRRRFLLDYLRYTSSSESENDTDFGDTPDASALAVDHMLYLIRMLVDCGANVNAACEDGRTPLHDSTSIDCTRALLVAGANVNAVDITSRTPLHDAVNCDVAKLLLGEGASVNATDIAGATPLHTTLCSPAHASHVRTLLDAGANTNIRANSGETPLLRACGNDNKWASQIVCMLLDSGAMVTNSVQNDTGDTELLATVRRLNRSNSDSTHPDLPDVRKLLNAGADVTVRSHKDGASAVHVAVQNSHTFYVLDTLLQFARNQERHGGPVLSVIVNTPMLDDDGLTPLMLATGRTSEKHVALLLQAGADVNAADLEGKTPLYFAAKGLALPSQTFKNERFVRQLIDAGADARNSTRAISSGDTPLLVATQGYSGGRALDAVEALLDAGADANVVNHLGNSAFHHAARSGDVKVLNALFRNVGLIPIVNARNLDNETPLSWAVEHQHPVCVRTLMDWGVDPDDGCALHLATHIGNERTVCALLQAGADPNARCTFPLDVVMNGWTSAQNLKTGSTPLHHAARMCGKHRSEYIARMLIHFGADVDLRDEDGNTAADITQEVHIRSHIRSHENCVLFESALRLRLGFAPDEEQTLNVWYSDNAPSAAPTPSPSTTPFPTESPRLAPPPNATATDDAPAAAEPIADPVDSPPPEPPPTRAPPPEPPPALAPPPEPQPTNDRARSTDGSGSIGSNAPGSTEAPRNS